jgi:hypothetical protein
LDKLSRFRKVKFWWDIELLEADKGMLVERKRGDRLGVFCLGVKGAALAAFGEIVVLRAPFDAVDKGLNEGESTFSRLALE